MRFGFHVSIRGGFKNVVARAQERNCETIQIFSRNPRGWKYRPLDDHDIALFRLEIEMHDIWPLFVHMPYLVNLASMDRILFRRSLDSLVDGLKRSARIGAAFLIMHVGSAPDPSRGLKQMSRGINRALHRAPNDIKILLENTAGSGNELGHDFRQLKEIIGGIEQDDRVGVVLDTAHAFAAGYDLRTEKAVNTTISEFDRSVGLRRLFLIHLNDSKTDCGSHRDRHWHIAQGKIGRGMSHILQHPALQDLPIIMETPRTDLKEDLMNLRQVKKLIQRRRNR